MAFDPKQMMIDVQANKISELNRTTNAQYEQIKVLRAIINFYVLTGKPLVEMDIAWLKENAFTDKNQCENEEHVTELVKEMLDLDRVEFTPKDATHAKTLVAAFNKITNHQANANAALQNQIDKLRIKFEVVRGSHAIYLDIQKKCEESESIKAAWKDFLLTAELVDQNTAKRWDWSEIWKDA